MLFDKLKYMIASILPTPVEENTPLMEGSDVITEEEFAMGSAHKTEVPKESNKNKWLFSQ